MAIRSSLAIVAGFLRCNRWGSQLGGEAAPEQTARFLPSVPEILDSTQAFIDQERRRLRDLRNDRASRAQERAT